jgi:putative transposase
MDSREVVAAGRQRHRVTARSLLCFWGVRELGLPLTDLARRLGLSPPGVSYAVQRGEGMVRENHYELVR